MTACYVLSDFIHTLPYSIERISKGEINYQDVMDDLSERAKIKKMESWLANALSDINTSV